MTLRVKPNRNSQRRIWAVCWLK